MLASPPARAEAGDDLGDARQARASHDTAARFEKNDPTASKKMQGNITVGVRPEAWRLVSETEGGLPITVTVVEELGADGFVYGTCDVEGTPGNVIVRVSGRDKVRKGDTIHVTTDPHSVHVFDTESGDRLSD